MQGTYEPTLVIVSVVVAILSSYTALSLAGRVATARGAIAWGWILGGALAMGTGIWAMHFVGMLAFRLPIPLGYDFSITLLSLLLPITASALALWLVSRPVLRRESLIAGAILIGIGINGMHYTGMEAMLMDPPIRYAPLLVALSLVIAIGAAGAAIWLAFRLRSGRRHLGLYRAAAACVMGLAIVGMHYTGMAAAEFLPGSICRAAEGGVDEGTLAVLVLMATVPMLVVALLASVYDARLEARSQVLALTESVAQERQTLLQSERAARAEAEQMGRLKDEFLATISHELRTPLNAILGWAELLRATRLDERRMQQGLETIERNARAQAQLIDDLLDMNRIVSGKVRLEMQPVAPAAIVDAAMESIGPTAQAKGVVLERSIDSNVEMVTGDPARLQQVLWNLLANAVKFTDTGGVVSVSVKQAERQVEITVADTGIGISPAFLPFVFDRFRQADAAITRSYRGLGLGLSIVKQLVELHGGTVHAASAGEGQGSAFSVRLPTRVTQDLAFSDIRGARVALDTASEERVQVQLRGLRVLVVDDEPDAQELMRRILEDCGAQVLTASGAAPALETLERETIDALVSDIGMPGMDGFALIDRVRAMPGTRGAVLAIALTAFTRRDDEKRAMRHGFDAFATKPIARAEFLRMLKRELEARRARNTVG